MPEGTKLFILFFGRHFFLGEVAKMGMEVKKVSRRSWYLGAWCQNIIFHQKGIWVGQKEFGGGEVKSDGRTTQKI